MVVANDLNVAIFKFPLEYDKEALLSLMVGNPMRTSFESISNTDWEIPMGGQPRPYDHLIQGALNKVWDELYSKYGMNFRQVDTWFQQYKQGDFHGWHTHMMSMFSSVIYVELPDDTMGTTLKHLGEDVRFDVAEGDYLIFPSYMLHRSPPNPYEDTKSIIAINLQVDNSERCV